MQLLYVLTLVRIVCTNQSVQRSTDRLKVSLYYEALDPYGIEFITQQFYPDYGQIGSYLFLDLVPYGNAHRKNVNGTWHFNCQNGPPECAVNKLEACGLAKNADQDKAIEFVNCIASHASSVVDEDKLAEICVPTLGLSANVLLKCAKGDEGSDLLALFGARTDGVQPRHILGVPTIVYSDHYVNDLDQAAISNFLGTTCKMLHYKPKACPTSNEIPSNF